MTKEATSSGSPGHLPGGGCKGIILPNDFRQQSIFEYQRDGAHYHIASAPAEGLHIIPAVLVERIHDRGCAEHEQHLALIHSNIQFIEIFLLDGIPLLNVLLVNQATAGAYGNCKKDAK